MKIAEGRGEFEGGGGGKYQACLPKSCFFLTVGARRRAGS